MFRRLRIPLAVALLVAVSGVLFWRLVLAPKIDLSHPPIAVRFTTTEAGYVTLVVESDKATERGRRVRNLITDTWYPAGDHTFWWDGLDESTVETGNIPGIGPYERHIGGSVVAPAEYRVRGLVRQAVEPRYQFAVYSGSQSPPWKTPSGRGGWLADHTPPSAALFLPASGTTDAQVLLSSPVAEAGEGLVWTDLDGRRVAGIHGIGEGDGWGGAELLARDLNGPHGKSYTYLAGAWFDHAEVWDLGGDRKAYSYSFDRHVDAAVGGLAVRDGV
ncbi:MAG TPA: hypothetical protein VHQ03_08575, partial [Candidatus Dormibacteraeota bacterium]|nr:hypothetical protein [Candidatus Dormibacteraeota bacterium]